MVWPVRSVLTKKAESAQDTITFILMQNTKTNVSQVKKEKSYGKRKNSTYILAMLPFAISYKKNIKSNIFCISTIIRGTI